MTTINDQELGQLRAMMAHRDDLGVKLGVAVAEYRQQEMPLVAKILGGDSGLALQLGALTHEFKRQKALFIGQIDQSRREERDYVKQVLIRHGKPAGKIDLETGEIVTGN